MRYIITESRLESIVFKYLDRRLKGIKKKRGKYLDTVFAFPGEEHGVISHNFTSDLYIFTDLVKDVMFMFSIDEDTARDFFGKYFESKYNLRVDRTPVIPYKDWAEFKIKKR
jgi:hypothetical protein